MINATAKVWGRDHGFPAGARTIFKLLREELARGSSLNIGFLLVNLISLLALALLLASYLGPEGFGAFAIGMPVPESKVTFVRPPGAAFVREVSA